MLNSLLSSSRARELVIFPNWILSLCTLKSLAHQLKASLISIMQGLKNIRTLNTIISITVKVDSFLSSCCGKPEEWPQKLNYRKHQIGPELFAFINHEIRIPKKRKASFVGRHSSVSWISKSSPFLLFFLDCLGSRRFRLPDGQLLLPWPMAFDHREKSPSRFAP